MSKSILNTNVYETLLKNTKLESEGNFLDEIIAITKFDYMDNHMAFCLWEQMGNLYMSIRVDEDGGQEYFILPIYIYTESLFSIFNTIDTAKELSCIVNFENNETHLLSRTYSYEIEEDIKKAMALFAYVLLTDISSVENRFNSESHKKTYQEIQDFLYYQNKSFENLLLEIITDDNNICVTDYLNVLEKD